MMKTKKHIWQFLFIFFMVSCTYEFPEIVQPTTEDLGSINVEKVVVAGDDFLSGFMDGALYSEGQKSSVGAVITAQLNNLQDVQFIQSSIETENGYNVYTSTQSEIFGKWIYRFPDNYALSPDRILTSGQVVQDYSGDKNLLNDITIPQLQVSKLNDNNLKSNPLFMRIAENENSNYIDQILQKTPSFIICWLGMNDFLNYAVKGGTNPEELTSTESFQSNFQNFIDEIIQNTNGKIVIGNLISIFDLPFFHTNQYNFIRITNAEKGAAQAVFSSYNAAVYAYNVGKPANELRPVISFEDNGSTLYPQPLVVIDENLPDATYPDGSPLEKYRQLTDDELALFSITSDMVKDGLGWKIPLSEEFYLSSNQVTQIENRTEAFNRIILDVAATHSDRIVISDIKSKVRKVAETARMDAWGIPVSTELVYINGVPLEGGLDQNSIFSLDALHFNQRGNAFIANIFLKSVNSAFNAKIPMANPNNFVGNVYFFTN